MDLSLDDIIKNNKSIKSKKGLPGRKNGKPFIKPALGIRKKFSPIKKKSLPRPNSNRIVDARSKIIQKNRTKIRDAREKIAESARKSIVDARQKLSNKKSPIMQSKGPIQRMPKQNKKNIIPRSKPGVRTMAISNELLYGEDDLGINEMDLFKLRPEMKRTVLNDMAYRAPVLPALKPKFPNFPTFDFPPDEEMEPSFNDPFDCYIPTRRPLPPQPPRSEIPRVDRYPTTRAMSAHMDTDAYSGPRKGILRSRQSEMEDKYEDYPRDRRYMEKSQMSSDSIRSRLYNEPRDRGESMGIFAKICSSAPVNRPPSPPSMREGCRIIVSNLHPTVTDMDIRELFSDIGPLLSSSLIRVGVAEVVFKNLRDAREAVETYHNRQLDDQPMKCMLVNPINEKSYAY